MSLELNVCPDSFMAELTNPPHWVPGDARWAVLTGIRVYSDINWRSPHWDYSPSRRRLVGPPKLQQAAKRLYRFMAYYL
ncbi:MAG: hypothetical protein ACTSUH_11295 [Candidatus Thorarchaeota archaeon]